MRRHPLFPAYSALATVCFFWGTTYVAIRIALETIPPLLLVATRFTISGTILMIAARMAGIRLPERKEIMHAALFGILGLGVGNACVTLAETQISSSLTALLITLSPFWTIGIDAVWSGGDRLSRRVLIGMFVGLAGAAMLVAPGVIQEGITGATATGLLLLQIGNAAWGSATIGQRRHTHHVNAVMSGAIQQLATGFAFWIPAFALGQTHAEWSWGGAGAVVYLMTFGSIVGYTAYIYALKKLPVPMVTIHVYVNPVVACVLGWAIFREPFGMWEAAAMGVVFIGVWLVKRFGVPPPLREPIPAPEP